MYIWCVTSCFLLQYNHETVTAVTEYELDDPWPRSSAGLFRVGFLHAFLQMFLHTNIFDNPLMFYHSLRLHDLFLYDPLPDLLVQVWECPAEGAAGDLLELVQLFPLVVIHPVQPLLQKSQVLLMLSLLQTHKHL